MLSFRFPALICLCVSIFWLSFPSCSRANDLALKSVSVSESFQKGQQHYFKQQFADAEKMFRRCVNLSPENAEYRCWLAQAMAFVMAEQAMRGVSKFSLIPVGKAIRELYQEALKTDPNCERARVGYSTLLRDIPGWLGGDVDKAEEMLTNVLKENPENVFALHNMGTLYIRKRKEYEKGLDYLKKAVLLDETKELSQEERFKLSNTNHAIGKTYLEELEKPAQALPYFQKSYEIYPGNIVTMLDLIDVYRELDQEQKAKEMLKKAYAKASQNEYKHFYGDIKRAARKLKMKECSKF